MNYLRNTDKPLDLIKYINWLNKIDKTTLKTSTPITATIILIIVTNLVKKHSVIDQL